MSFLCEEKYYHKIFFKCEVEVKVKVTQLCPLFVTRMVYTVRGILQARTLQWVAFPFSRGCSQTRD